MTSRLNRTIVVVGTLGFAMLEHLGRQKLAIGRTASTSRESALAMIRRAEAQGLIQQGARFDRDILVEVARQGDVRLDNRGSYLGENDTFQAGDQIIHIEVNLNERGINISKAVTFATWYQSQVFSTEETAGTRAPAQLGDVAHHAPMNPVGVRDGQGNDEYDE